MGTSERKTVSLKLSILLLLLALCVFIGATNFNEPPNKPDVIAVPYYNDASFTPFWDLDNMQNCKSP